MRLLRTLLSLAAVLVAPALLPAQSVLRQPDTTLVVPKGASTLLVAAGKVTRFSVGDPDVAEAVALSPTELLVNAKTVGTTSLFVWTNDKVRHFGIEVATDVAQLERYLQTLLPGAAIRVTASGKAVTLTGQVRDASQAQQAIAIAKGASEQVIDNLVTPAPLQVQLSVRFAEMSRNAMEQYSAAIRTVQPQDLSSSTGTFSGGTNSTVGDVTFGLVSGAASLDALLNALKARGEFRSLAEPNLITLPGREATFLAGGEFPFPTLQGGAANGGVTITFRDFGIKLKFTPIITSSGSVRLKLAPEVSQLDFANALQIQGFRIPSLLVRRAETEVELDPGQHLAIAGLVDNSLLKNVAKIPLLGDLPILGQLFRSKNAQQRRTELVVLITPTIVRPSNTALPVTTGEAAAWPFDKSIRQMLPDSAGPR